VERLIRGRRLGMSQESIELTNTCKLAKALHCLPSAIRKEKEIDIEVMLRVLDGDSK
jgi:hypothetical protein